MSVSGAADPWGLFHHPEPDLTLPASASTVGFIDSALIGSRLRLRLDGDFHNDRPDRAEFFVPKNRSTGAGRGFGLPERNIDMVEFSAYAEKAYTPRVSAFVEMPLRAISPEINNHEAGFGDLNAGFKVAYFALPDLVQTFQFRIITPTGDGGRGLGTEHTTLEPALLVFQRVNPSLVIEAEVRDWIPVSGTDFAGNVLRYGIGLGYDLASVSDRYWVRPVVELVGWTQIRGAMLTVQEIPGHNPPTAAVVEATRDTIINGILGVRAGTERMDVYVGYARALTGPSWFDNTVRLEVRWLF